VAPFFLGLGILGAQRPDVPAVSLVMLAIALVADAVLCAVFALMVRVSGPPIVRSEIELRQVALDNQCQDEGAIRARMYELFLDGQNRALADNGDRVAGPPASDWQLAKGGWYAAGLDEDEGTEMRMHSSHLTWCEDLRDELARDLAAEEHL
jgi:hypothetical protein